MASPHWTPPAPTLWSAPPLPRVFARGALLLAGWFLLSGIAAVFGSPGLILATVMSVLQAVRIVAAAVGFALINSLRRGYR